MSGVEASDSRAAAVKPLFAALLLLAAAALLTVPLLALLSSPSSQASFEIEAGDPSSVLTQLQGMLEEAEGRVSSATVRTSALGPRARLEASIPASALDAVFAEVLSAYEVVAAESATGDAADRVFLQEAVGAADEQVAAARAAVASAAPTASSLQMTRLVEDLAAAEAARLTAAAELSRSSAEESVATVEVLIRTPRRFAAASFWLLPALLAAATAAALPLLRSLRRRRPLAPPASL